MTKAVLLLVIALTVAGCQQSSGGGMDRYVRNHEPKTGGPDL
jgi:hypothetical protein